MNVLGPNIFNKKAKTIHPNIIVKNTKILMGSNKKHPISIRCLFHFLKSVRTIPKCLGSSSGRS